MPGEQWDERDNAFIKDSIEGTNIPYQEPVMLKKFIGITDPGDPANGIQAQLGYKLTPLKSAIVNSVTQQDVLYSGGLYQIGDIRISLIEELNYIDTIQQIGGQSVGDRISYRKHDYRIVGKIDHETLIGNDRLHVYVFRKVGNT
jgi:hypothetical protein